MIEILDGYHYRSKGGLIHMNAEQVREHIKMNLDRKVSETSIGFSIEVWVDGEWKPLGSLKVHDNTNRDT